MAMSLYEKTIAMLALAMVASHVANALKCEDLLYPLNPCAEFLMGAGPDDKPEPECCAGVDKVNMLASTVEARRTICQCFKTALATEIDLTRAKKLPSLCHLQVSFEISPDVDCSKIQ